jgi:hypothetical protein
MTEKGLILPPSVSASSGKTIASASAPRRGHAGSAIGVSERRKRSERIRCAPSRPGSGGISRPYTSAATTQPARVHLIRCLQVVLGLGATVPRSGAGVARLVRLLRRTMPLRVRSESSRMIGLRLHNPSSARRRACPPGTVNSPPIHRTATRSIMPAVHRQRLSRAVAAGAPLRHRPRPPLLRPPLSHTRFSPRTDASSNRPRINPLARRLAHRTRCCSRSTRAS